MLYKKRVISIAILIEVVSIRVLLGHITLVGSYNPYFTLTVALYPNCSLTITLEPNLI